MKKIRRNMKENLLLLNITAIIFLSIVIPFVNAYICM